MKYSLKKLKENKYYQKVVEYVRTTKPTLKLVLFLLFLMWMTAHVRGCIEEAKQRKVYPRPVQTALATKKDVPIFVESFGTLSSPESVDIKAQVTGKIKEVNFKQGEEVSAGDLLFTIDPIEYEADASKARAQLAEDISDLKLKMDVLKRNKSLIEKNLISQQDFEQYQTDAAAAEAKVQLDEANLELARVNLGYCYIKSPINGLAGKRQVDVGNIISANTGPVLVNVKKIDELYIDFTLPERELPKVRDAMTTGPLKVIITVEGESKDKAHYGELEFVDNNVDDETGTFSLRAKVDNADSLLWPGQFVKVKLILGTEKDAVLVPYEAAQIGKSGYYIFVIERGGKADLRMVTVGTRDNDDIVIEKGVSSGERVVTAGQMGLTPGMPTFDVTEKMKKKENSKKTKTRK